MIHTYTRRKLCLFPFRVNLIDRTANRTFLGGLIIVSVRLLVHAQESGHVPIPLSHLTAQDTSRRIEINMRITILLAHVGKAIGQEMNRV